MAIGIGGYPNIDTTDPTNYPAGNIKDDPLGVSGTPINVQTTSDIHQTFYRALERSAMTANGSKDNVSNGYQYAQALGLEKWISGGTLSYGTAPSGTFTAGTILYNKYHRSGKTLHYQLIMAGASVSGTVSDIYITLPFLTDTFELTVVASSLTKILCGVEDILPIYTTFENPLGFGFNIKKLDGTNFAGAFNLNINLVAELH